jgi:hypothetical protein
MKIAFKGCVSRVEGSLMDSSGRVFLYLGLENLNSLLDGRPEPSRSNVPRGFWRITESHLDMVMPTVNPHPVSQPSSSQAWLRVPLKVQEHQFLSSRCFHSQQKSLVLTNARRTLCKRD